MRTKTNRRQSREAINNREDFVNSTGSLRGVRGKPSLPWQHWLDDAEKARYTADFPLLEYVVFSYDTPIAWMTEDGHLYRVAQKFSSTTSQHMGMTWVSQG